MPIAHDAFIGFLLNAKRNTYAAQGDGASVAALLPGSRQLEYREGALLYRDIYFGGDFFVGQETVYYDTMPLWAMGYAGGLTANTDPRIYAFLRAALREVTPERPYRGPGEFQESGLTYRDASEGSVENFAGVETIAQKGVLVYRLRYHGGFIR